MIASITVRYEMTVPQVVSAFTALAAWAKELPPDTKIQMQNGAEDGTGLMSTTFRVGDG